MISRCPGAAVRTCRDWQLEGVDGGPGPSQPPARASSATPKPGCLSQGHGWQRGRADRGQQSSAGPGLRSQHQSPAQRPSPSPSPPAGLGLGGGERGQPSVSSCPPEVRITAEVYSPQIQNFQHQKSLSRLVRWQKRVCPTKVTDCPALGLWTHPCVWLRVGMGSRSTRAVPPSQSKDAVGPTQCRELQAARNAYFSTPRASAAEDCRTIRAFVHSFMNSKCGPPIPGVPKTLSEGPRAAASQSRWAVIYLGRCSDIGTDRSTGAGAAFQAFLSFTPFCVFTGPTHSPPKFRFFKKMSDTLFQWLPPWVTEDERGHRAVIPPHL